MVIGRESCGGGLRLPRTVFGVWRLLELERSIHRATPDVGVVHSSALDEKSAETHATVVALRSPRGWVGLVWEAQMRDWAAAAARRTWAAIAVAGVSLLLLTACNDAETPEPTRTSSVSSTPSTASPSPSPSQTRSETPEERDARLAGEAVVKYWAVVDDLAANPTKSLNLLDPVARDQARAQRQIALGTYAAKGWVQSGTAALSGVTASSKDGRTFTVTACVDVSGIDFVDEKGDSQVNPDRPDQQSFGYTVVKAKNEFFVTRDTLKGKPC